jgi:cytochrome P450
MKGLFSDEMRRNPYPLYEQMRNASPVHYVPPPFDAWLIFDYQNVKRALNDHDAFSSQVPAPPHWFIFFDPPSHTKLRALISQAFTPRAVASLEPRIRELSRHLLDKATERGEMDFAAEYSVPLPMMVIAEMIGMPIADWPQFNRWSDAILKLSHTRSGSEQGVLALSEFSATTAEMNAYLAEMIESRRTAPQDDLLTRLVTAELEGQHLAPEEILGFFQVLIVAGQETTTNLINNAILCLAEHPDQRERLQQRIDLVPSAIEEVLRYRSPVQWVMRTPRRDVEVLGNVIPAGKLVLPMIGSANRDPEQFPRADRFDIERNPNPHVAFGHGIHFCLGAPLARLEARVALLDVLERARDFEFANNEPWEPRHALNVHGPARLPIRFQRARQVSASA